MERGKEYCGDYFKEYDVDQNDGMVYFEFEFCVVAIMHILFIMKFLTTTLLMRSDYSKRGGGLALSFSLFRNYGFADDIGYREFQRRIYEHTE